VKQLIMEKRVELGDESESEVVDVNMENDLLRELNGKTTLDNISDVDEFSDSESEPEVFHDCDNCEDSDVDDSSSDCFQYKDSYFDDKEQDLDSLEYEYEPGINLSSMEFSRIIELGHCHGCRCNQEAQHGHCPSCSCHQESDLQLAAELGKTLLERNKELENSLKHQQAIIDDQAQEIEYLTKQTAALREVNDSRLRIYEQLEISITELEKNNIRLNEESNSDKSRIKSLCSTVDLLEVRCEELQRSVDEARSQERIRKRREKRRTSHKEEASSRKASGQDTVCQNGFGTTSDEDESFGDIPEVHLDGEGRDSPGMGARESGYSSTCADSLGHLNTDSDNDIRSHSPDDGANANTTVKDALLVTEIFI